MCINDIGGILMEKICSGQSYLYRANKLNSTVIEVQLKDNVEGDKLQQALSITLTRYPYMTSRLVEKNGDFYLAECRTPMEIVNTNEFRTLNSSSTGYHLIDVTYTQNKIRIAFHHALCDGRGIKPFVETLIYYYCCLNFNKKFDSTGIRLAGELLLPGETEEPIGKSKYEIKPEELPNVTKSGFRLPENDEDTSKYYRTEININRREFVNYMKENAATPAILLSLWVSDTILTMYPEVDKPVVCSMAVDLRKELGKDHTHKNFVGSMYLPYTEETRKLELYEKAKLYRDLMQKQKEKNSIKNMANTLIGLTEKLEQLSTIHEKKQVLSFLDDLCIDTYVISYLGQMELGGCEKFVDSMHLYNSGVKGLRINMISAGDYISVDVLQSFKSTKFIETFFEGLNETGIEFNVSELTEFET